LGPIVLRLDPIVRLTDDVLLKLSSLNDALRIEKNAEGDLEVLPPGNITSGNQNSLINRRLGNWSEEDGTGEIFDSSSGFTLPNGAIRGPDASWVLKSRLAELTNEEKIHGFARISPDFVIELRSNSDSLTGLRRKMEEYVENGVRLGWLIDPLDPLRRVYIYRPEADVEILEGPESLSGEPELPGLILDLKTIWEPGF
jgi:Uma2 family endonuclease